MSLPDGRWLVVAVVSAALVLVGFLGWRSYANANRDDALCEKIDRFIVSVEHATVAAPDQTATEKQDTIDFYENFRNDPPVCRTAPAVTVPTAP